MSKKARLSDLSAALIAISVLIFAFRGKIGAIFITMSLVLNALLLIRSKGKRSKYNIYAAVFLFLFAFITNCFRSLSPEYYLIIGYLAVVVLLLESTTKYYDGIWLWLKRIALFESAGVYLQWLTPGVYYPLVSIILPNEVVASIRNRLIAGYYTGFSREVSYTMFLIVVGLGIYVFLENNKKRRIDYVAIAFLFGALLISGKRATLLFCVVGIFLTQFIKSRDKLKILKYAFRVAIGITAVWVTYPWWSKINALSRLTEIIQYISLQDMIGVTNGRTVIYNNAMELWKTNIWFGIGWGNFKYSVMNNLWYSGFDVHNCFLQVLCETGITGFVFYIFLIIISITNVCRSIQLIRKGNNLENTNKAVFCGFIQIFFILYSLTEPILYEYTDYMIFFCCYSSTSMLLREYNTRGKTISKTNA